MSTFVLMYFCTFFVRKWLRAVKIYLHAKFRASSSKIERVMLNFVFGAGPSTGTAACDQPTCRAVRFAPAKKHFPNPTLTKFKCPGPLQTALQMEQAPRKDQ